MSELERLSEWYAAQCDGDWEHSWGVTIDTLDNPGWTLKVDVPYWYHDVQFTPITVDRSEEDWIYCDLRDGVFVGAGGARNLAELIGIFNRWIEGYASTPRDEDDNEISSSPSPG